MKHNAKGVCPHCGRELTMKPRGRIGKLQDRETCQVVQRTHSGELVIRIIKVIATLTEIKIWENTRQKSADFLFQCFKLWSGKEFSRCDLQTIT